MHREIRFWRPPAVDGWLRGACWALWRSSGWKWLDRRLCYWDRMDVVLDLLRQDMAALGIPPDGLWMYRYNGAVVARVARKADVAWGCARGVDPVAGKTDLDLRVDAMYSLLGILRQERRYRDSVRPRVRPAA